MSGETEEQVSGWTVDTMYAHLQRQVDDLRSMLDERYATQTKAVDAAFLAQQTAMQTALTAAERAVQTALLAAEKAVIKAETAADKRFESVNEFRAQLADQARTFMARTEAEAAIARNTERVQELTDRLNRTEGRSTGLNAGWVFLVGAVSVISALAALYLALRP